MLLVVQMENCPRHLSIHNCDAVEFPSCKNLETLTLEKCEQLHTLDDYQKLKYLSISSCLKLQSIGELSSLSVLHLSQVRDCLFSSFPFEQLEELAVKYFFSPVPAEVPL
jgi:hypothetical protein